MRNPWKKSMRKADHGRAVIHVSPDAGPVRFTKKYLIDLVESAVRDGSIVFQVGFYQGSRERSAQVVLINGGHKGVLRWAAFMTRAKSIAAGLCATLMQHAVILELESATRRYQALTFTNDLGEEGVNRQRETTARKLRRRK